MTVTGAPVALRPRTGPEIIDAAIPLMRRAYAAAVLVWLCYSVPITLLWRMHPLAWPRWTFYPVTWVLGAFPAAVITMLLSDAYLGRPVRLDLALAHVARRVVPLYLLRMFRLAAIALGLVCFVLPGIVFWGVTCVSGVALLLEDLGPGPAIRRSEQLTHDELWRTLFLLAGVALIVGAVRWSLALLYSQIVVHHLLYPSAALAVDLMLDALFAPFTLAVLVVLYYDLRIRKEGFDLELMAQALCAPGAP